MAFTPKPQLGLAMLERARQAGIPFAWITGDSVYGADSAIRHWAERHRCGYVLTITSGQHLDGPAPRPEPGSCSGAPGSASAANGPRVYDRACLPYCRAAPGLQCALLVRRAVARSTELTFYLTHAFAGIALAELVRVAGSRWSIESLFEQAKGAVGLDQYEARSWVGWHRHITRAMFALAYFAALRQAAAGGSGPCEPRCHLPMLDFRPTRLLLTTPLHRAPRFTTLIHLENLLT